MSEATFDHPRDERKNSAHAHVLVDRSMLIFSELRELIEWNERQQQIREQRAQKARLLAQEIEDASNEKRRRIFKENDGAHTDPLKPQEPEPEPAPSQLTMTQRTDL